MFSLPQLDRERKKHRTDKTPFYSIKSPLRGFKWLNRRCAALNAYAPIERIRRVRPGARRPNACAPSRIRSIRPGARCTRAALGAGRPNGAPTGTVPLTGDGTGNGDSPLHTPLIRSVRFHVGTFRHEIPRPPNTEMRGNGLRDENSLRKNHIHVKDANQAKKLASIRNFSNKYDGNRTCPCRGGHIG